MTNLAARHTDLVEILRRSNPAPVMRVPLESPDAVPLDLSIHNPLVAATDCHDSAGVARLIAGLIRRGGGRVGIGGYGERRGWYARGEQFHTETGVRTNHLGVDIWAAAGEPVFSPYRAVVESFRDNALSGDYGPTVILRHELEGRSFFTLFGHLSRESLADKSVGATLEQGACIGSLGAPSINGDWPSHLHLQIILDLLGNVGDYPGVAAEAERDRYLTLCPDPNLILRSPLLARATPNNVEHRPLF